MAPLHRADRQVQKILPYSDHRPVPDNSLRLHHISLLLDLLLDDQIRLGCQRMGL